MFLRQFDHDALSSIFKIQEYLNDVVPLVKVILCTRLRGNLFLNMDDNVKRFLIGIKTHFNFHGIQNDEILKMMTTHKVLVANNVYLL